MSKRSEPTTSKALEELRYALANGKGVPKVLPEWLKPFNIRRNPAVFQHRDPHEGDSAWHIKTMAAALTRGISADLGHLTVWWDGKGWCCIDGHHRLEAYRKADKVEHDAPVRVFTGTLDEAIGLAAQANTCSNLNMSGNERIRTAWRLVCITKLSRAQTVAASKVSDGTVSNMRRVRDILNLRSNGPGPWIDACDLSWYAAQSEARGGAPTEPEGYDDDKRRSVAADWTKRICKALPPGHANQDDIWDLVIWNLGHQLRERLTAAWGGNDE